MTRTLRTLILFSATLLVADAALSYVLVRKDGSKIEVDGAPEYRDGQAIVRLPGGSTGSLPEDSIDKAATDKANQAEPESESEAAVEPSKKKSLGESAPGGHAKSSFTNEDLQKSEGSVVEGSVNTGESNESEEEWAKRHDEEMKARYGGGEEEETPADDQAAVDAAMGAEAGGDAPPAGGEAAPEEKEETQEEKIARLEQEVDDLRQELADLDRAIGGGAGDAVTVNKRLQTASDLTDKERELAEAR